MATVTTDFVKTLMKDYDALILLVTNISNMTEEELGWDPKAELFRLKNWFYSKMDRSGLWTISSKKGYEAALTFTS